MKLFVRDLTVIDASYLHAQRGFVGESYQVDITLQGALNEQSMLLDFSLVKKQIKAIIDAEVDHKLLVPQAGDACTVLENGQRTQLNFTLSDNSVIQLKCPAEAYCFLPSDTINIGLLETYLTRLILRKLPENISALQIKLRNEQLDTPYYHYTHGLKKHNGNCQRIAHGHRSKIDIYIDNVYNSALVKEWADRWQDSYLLSREDIIDKSQLSFTAIENETAVVCSAYNAPQGYFELLMPAHKAQILPKDTTVEELANYLCMQIKNANADNKVTVYAYEGIGKGAIAEM